MKSKIKIKITGRNLDYFLNLLISKNINIDSLEKSKKSLIIILSEKDYQKLKKIKTSYKIKIIKTYGLLYIQHLIKNYFSFLVCFLISIGILLLISSLIIDIDVVTSNKELKKTILEDMKVRGISKFKFKASYNRRVKIVNEILEEENDTIEWLEIEEFGTKYIVNVVERKKNKEEDACFPSNIVAKKNAIVKNIEATSGEVKTAINRSVKKGDVLISGNIFNKDEIVNTKCSKGRVFGEVWYQVYVDLPKHYYEENTTGNVERRIGFDFLDYKSKSSFKTYKSKDINLFNNKLLPIRVFFTEYLETNVIDKKFNIENVDSYALEKATKKLSNKLGKDDKILLKKILKKEDKDSRIIVGVFFKVYEDITKIEKIEEIPKVLPEGE